MSDDQDLMVLHDLQSNIEQALHRGIKSVDIKRVVDVAVRSAKLHQSILKRQPVKGE